MQNVNDGDCDTGKKPCTSASTFNATPSSPQYVNAQYCMTPQNYGLESKFLGANQPKLSPHCNIYKDTHSQTCTSNVTQCNEMKMQSPSTSLPGTEQISITPLSTGCTSSLTSSTINRSLLTTFVPTISQKLTALMPRGNSSQNDMRTTNDTCVHPSHNAMPMTSCISEIPLEYYERQLKKYTLNSADNLVNETARINGQLNEIFLKRLKDIDNNAGSCLELKLVTYQEWVDMLLKVNESFISNMELLETQIAERLELVQQCMQANYQRIQCHELMKCRKDIDHLIKIIQDAYHNDKWDIKNVLFETITPTQILGAADLCRMKPKRTEDISAQIKNNNDVDKSKQLYANIKALAIEVAEKYDETRMLKEHIACMENEIQNAQKKIKLKDDVIRELRNDLKCINNKFIDDCSQFDSLSFSEAIEQQKLKLLEDELADFFEINHEFNKHKIEIHRKRIADMFQKSEMEKAEACRKLDAIRRRLIDIETSSNETINDGDSGFSSKSDNDRDFKILESIRHRLRKLNDTIFELKKHIQKLELENNELETNLRAEKTFSECNSDTLKEVADLLCSMINKQFSYTDIYNDECNSNPFCEAILQIKNHYDKQEAQLLTAVSMKNKKIEDLNKAFLTSEQQFNEERRLQINENLKCQIEHLQDTIAEREKRIMQLSAMLARITQGTAEIGGNAIEYGNCHNAYDNVRVHDLEKKVEQLTNELNKSHEEQHFLHIETRKLNEELNESKRKNGNLLTQTKRLSSLLKSQEAHRIELACKYEALDKCFEDQSRKLREANTRLATLNERFHLMEKCQSEHDIECNILREEVLSLKEKEADLLGRQKSMQEQLMIAEKELYTAHDVIKEQQSILQKTESSHRDVIKRLQEANNDIKQKMSSIVEDYKRLEEEYKKQREICIKNEKLIGSLRKWKESQQKIEERTRDTFKQYEEHIRLLLQEKQRFVEEYRDLYRDYTIIQDEIDRTRINSITMPGYTPSQKASDTAIGDRLSVIREVTQRLSDQSHLLNEDKLVPRNFAYLLKRKSSIPKEE